MRLDPKTTVAEVHVGNRRGCLDGSGIPALRVGPRLLNLTGGHSRTVSRITDASCRVARSRQSSPSRTEGEVPAGWRVSTLALSPIRSKIPRAQSGVVNTTSAAPRLSRNRIAASTTRGLAHPSSTRTAAPSGDIQWRVLSPQERLGRLRLLDFICRKTIHIIRGESFR